MKRATIISYIGAIACIALMCASFTFCIIKSLKPLHFTFFLDPLIAPEMRTIIMKTAHDLYQTNAKGQWEKNLKDEFPFIRKITSKKTKPYAILISIYASSPWLLANENLVVTESGVLVPRTLYAAHYLDLPVINVRMPSRSLEQFSVNWLEHIPKDFFSTHSISIEHANSVVIQDRLQKNIPIRMSTHQKIDQSMIEKCSDAEKKLIEFKKIKKIIPTAWMADFRFCKQIIFYQAKGREDRV